ncbi:TonB-dependent receptor [Pseudomonas extremaustralis]|uniref:Iron complex outermembrane recepter protein n=2 Tax=Gammaproteobacteria TaxID=1236 RepID=A0A5C5QDY8_9PSED|nr:TonB-dependent receptor [Pseudomonas extremaustralis]EZI24493.1 TonB-dependent receptor [Pseudomonas extremaustralis 14-3 substr. 14-3b]MDG2968682.1 TonB-dependent receptor [Pseudomonas extremaustralis]TWS03530.1 TonB-dependent receptor [Pseudomonas extremaustralis]UUJ41765.1 TonB-dependent receptor [Pseudomonas extremaustralis]SDF34749.1 iron complex outermembrane recepter protein [Pseudomonas extremaustralis]
MRFTRIHLALVAASMGHGMVMADTGDSDVGTIGVQGKATAGGGYMVQEESIKGRSTVTKEALDKQTATGNAIDKLKYTPGLNISSEDATGLSGFRFTMRGLNSDQVGMSVDGMPINDSGNYALYSNLLGDPENIDQIFVTQGSSEADGPHIGSSGGNIGIVTIRPTKETGAFVKQTVGSNATRKTFARLNTGEVNGLSNWLSASHTEGQMWRGSGAVRADKVEWNSFFDAGNGNTANLILKYHEQDNNSYSQLTKSQFQQNGRKFDPYPATPTVGSNGKLNSYYALAQNPFQTFTGVLNTQFKLADNLALSVIPYYYWGNGSGVGSSSYALNRGSNAGGVFDLGNLPTAAQYNADGSSTTGVYYRPSRTQTWRPGITTKLNWDLGDHSLQFGYWYERARQSQTQPFIALKSNGKPTDTWPDGDAVVDANGNTVQGRDRFTVTPAQKVWTQDTWYINPDWTLVAGLAYMNVKRDGTNNGSLTEQPEKRHQTYNKLLPNAGLKYQLDERDQLFYSLSRNMRIPQNYVLYDKGVDSINSKPETSWNHELGWRFTGDDMTVAATLFYMQFKDRQVSSKDINGDFADINAGSVNNSGLELEWSGLLPHHFNYYTSYTYTKAEQQDDLTVYNAGKAILLPTSGKQFANVPKNMLAANIGYDDGRFYGTFGGKYTSKLYGDLTNDEAISGRTVFNAGAGIYLPVDKKVVKDATLRLNVDNLFDKKYLDGVYTTKTNAASYSGFRDGDPAYIVGLERTVTVSLEANF